MPSASKGRAKKSAATAKSTAKSSAKTAAKSAAKSAAKPKSKAKAAATSASRSGSSSSARAAAKKKPAAKRRPSSKALDKFLEGQQKALLEERATYTRQAQALREEADLLAEDWEPGDTDFGEEGGEGNTVAVERERDLALSAQAQAEVDDIDAALARIEEGTYGICQQCGSQIPKERLKALPQAALCVQCKSGGFGRR